VQRILRESGVKFVQAVWQPGAPQPGHGPAEDPDLVLEEADAGNGAHHEEIERGRGLLALLPALLGNEADDDEDGPGDGRSEPLPAPPERPAKRPLPARNVALQPGARLGREELRKLQAVLHDLGECRKLLGAALGQAAGSPAPQRPAQTA
jgi:hypothetical protein